MQNGQTGELVGSLPVDNGRYWAFVGAVSASAAAVGALIVLFMGVIGG